MKRQNRARSSNGVNGLTPLIPAKAGIHARFGIFAYFAKSSRSRALLLTTVVASALCIVAPDAKAGPGPCVVGPANTVTCSGNHSNGVREGEDFDAPPITTLIVENLTSNIGVTSDEAIQFSPGPGSLTNEITITSNTGPFAIITQGAGSVAIQANAQNGAKVTINHTGNIQASGGDGISAQVTNSDANEDTGDVLVSLSGNIVMSGGDAITANSAADIANAGSVQVGLIGNISTTGGGIDATSRSTTGNSGFVAVISNGNITAGSTAISAESTVAANGNSGIVQIIHDGAIQGFVNAASTVGGNGNSGMVTVTTSGAIFGQINALSFVDGIGNASNVTVTSNGSISAGALAIDAQSLSDGGSAGLVDVHSTGNIASAGIGIRASNRATTGTADKVTVTNDGDMTTGSSGIVAISQAPGGTSGSVEVTSSGNITATDGDGISVSSTGGVARGDLTVTIKSGAVRGGGQAGIGVFFSGGATNTLTIEAPGVVLAESGQAILGGDGDETVRNFGTISGNVFLGDGANAFNNNAGGLFNAGATVFLGDGNLLQNAGTLSPGGNGTTLTTTLTGDLVLANGGTYAVDVSTGSADRINVSGSATLGGRVLPIVLGLLSSTQEFTILSAEDGITNNGITVQDTAIFDFELRIEGEDLILSVAAVDLTAGNANLTPNQRAVANHLQGVMAAGVGPLGNLFAYLGSLVDVSAYAAALDRLHPEPYLAQLKSVLYASLGFTDAMQSCPVSSAPNAAATLKEGQCAWVRMGGRALEVDRSRENIGFNDKSWGGSAGVQFNLAPDWLGSVAIGYDRSDIRVDDRATASGDLFQIGAGLKYSTGPWQLSGALTGGMASYDTKRFNLMPGVNASGDADMHFVAGRLRAAHVFGTDASYIKPLVDLDAIVVRRNGFTESGAGAAGLNVRGETDAFISIAPAVEFGGTFSYASGSLLRPYLRVGVRLFSNDDLSASATFIGTPAGVPAFTATTPLGQWVGEVSAGLEILNSDRWDARIAYDGRFAERTTQHGGNIKLRARF